MKRYFRILFSIFILLSLVNNRGSYISAQTTKATESNKGYLKVPQRQGNELGRNDFRSPNSIYVIEKDYMIPKGMKVSLAENITLFFNGGSISGEGTLVLNKAVFSGFPKVFCAVEGALSGFVYPEWFKSADKSWDKVFNTICNMQCEVRLRSNAIYKLSKPLYMGYSCFIEGGTNSTLLFDKCSTCIYVGHSNKLEDFNIAITNPKSQPVAIEINTEYLGKTVVNGDGTSLPFSFYWGSLLNIYIDHVNVNYDGDGTSYSGYGVKMIANRNGQNGWNINVSNCIICGYFDYAFYLISDDTFTKNPVNSTAWFTDVYFYNNRIVRSRNGFYIGRGGARQCLAIEKVLISGCSMQGGGEEDRHPYFVNADCVNNLAVRDCMAWDWTANGGKAYRFTSNCKAVEIWDADNTGYVFDGNKGDDESRIVFKSNNKYMPKRGSSKNRPKASLYNDGDMYFDTSLKKPLWKYGDKWYDANGKAY